MDTNQPIACPLCGTGLSQASDAGFYYHPPADCILSGFEVSCTDVPRWNRRALLAAASAQATVQPVAWECASPAGEKPALAFLTSKKPTVEHYENQGWRVTPLYATPPQDGAQIRDALKGAAVIADAAGAEIRSLRTQNEMLRQELRNIANADTVEWDDPTEFEAWAKSRARHALSQQEG
ncbi:hypothetical protein [Paraburkholderia tuberum]|uniref:Uncharacterized protein n=1 Tax=Paraburkholderia tuberum TaxID=157910 RepID=A0A1H1JT84_9BURK|nr:hypothetical protein [Paraburkholderia tuberum]SDR52717.1 hypothetical protein SAMN05445850_5529 [Paraburkholderia tuberum]